MAGVLSGIKVIDLSKGIAGPMTTMMMADNGASVTKIDPPGGDRFSIQNGYTVWSRGKDHETIDLKSKDGLDRFLKLVDEADVLVESFAPGKTTSLGIDYETLSKRNPRLIYCSITAYGRDNPHSDRPGYDALVAARTGLQWEQRGWPEGAEHHINGAEGFAPELEVPYDWVQGPARPGPVFPASRWPSLGAFFAASLGISAALRVRGLTGKGQLVETSLMRGAFAAAWAVWQRGENPDAKDFSHWVFGARSPKGHFKTKDGKWVHEWAPNPRFTLESSENGPSPDLAVKNDPNRFGMGNEELISMMHYQEPMAEAVAKHDADFWVDAGRIAKMPLQVCRPVEEALNDPLMLADGCVKERDVPGLGTIREAGHAYTLSLCDPKQPGPPTTEPAPSNPCLRRPMEGIRVVDFGMAVAGPYGTQLLSDLGADVIKIGTLTDRYFHDSSVGMTCNRGKRSLQVNLKDPRGMEIIHRIIATADIVQHNMRYTAAQKLGIDFESLKKIKPDLIYCHTRGHEHGPREDMSGNDQTGAALAGIQYEDGAMANGGKPMWMLTSFGDTGNGFFSAIGMIQAVMHRDRTGQGQFVDTAIINAAFHNLSHTFAFPDGTGPDRLRIDKDQTGLCALYRIYETADGWVCIAVMQDSEWNALKKVVGSALEDARFADREARDQNDAALTETLRSALKAKPAKEWVKLFDAAGVPAEYSDPEFSMKMFDDKLFRERGWTVGFRHAAVGFFEQCGLLVDLSDTPGKVQGTALISGEHSREILSDFGYSRAETDALIAAEVVRQE